MSARLQDTKRTTLDVTGAGNLTFGPGRPGERWIVERISVSVSTNTNEAACYIRRGLNGPLITATISGSSGDTDDGLNESLWSGETIAVQWQGGDSGAIATATVWGTIDV